ncbi:MAG TPA: hypothetical protein VFT41_02605 [Gemmatimonadaceae bacterium]|nr:hypothetical protein [Gemmatimonadaceae bacterium]
MFLPRSRIFALLTAALAVAAVAACSDNLESNSACPLLCPGQQVTLHDTTLDAVIVDSSVSGFPALGEEPYLLVSTRGDSLDARAIIRFDSLPSTFTRTNSPVDTTIVGVDSSFLMLRVDTTAKRPGAPITVRVYDVDTKNPDSTATDTSVALLAPLFSADRLLGSATYDPDSLRDSLRVPISSDSLFDYIKHGRRLRVGVMVTGPNRAQLRIGTTVGYNPAQIVFKPAPAGDTTGVKPLYVQPLSKTPYNSGLASNLMDYLLVVRGTGAPSSPVLAVGGLPGHRVYLRFALPARIVDSSTVVRATLLLHQVANPLSPDAHDTSTVWPQAIIASAAVTDLARALRILSTVGGIGLDTLEHFAPADSGMRQFEMVQLVRAWTASLTPTDPRALAMRTQFEGASGALYWFTPSSGPAAWRPRIEITYAAPPSKGGTP